MYQSINVLRNGVAWNSSFRRTFFSRTKRYDFGKCNLITELGNVSPERRVPEHIPKPPYYFVRNSPSDGEGKPEIKSNQQIAGMRDSCRLAATILDRACRFAKVGITTDAVDDFVHEETIKANAYPSPLRYLGFPKSVCTSVNNVACHGIPDDRKLLDGDIINIDITVFYNGFHGDCSKTVLIGNVDDRGKYLVENTELCLAEAILCCGPGQPLCVIGKSIEKYAKRKKLNVMPAFLGHGIGSYFHGPPNIFHFDNDFPGVMLPGMTFTIEPVLTLGDSEAEILDDAWTAVSVDNARSAQFEHTVLITTDGCEVLTVTD
ncbi:methionine aminopeptidase 1D, mitochondrial [Anopheles ziemanni]|uniref:methionine aminopeptidase 1D, mitochondrial n=1 Tax=Anopheles coustani TaxID=139045 RepID=UPI002657B3F2|nr:methionine aminopeptidase 1D, mitochondrial [Anopheles coustani]XP_058166454.1 methionine aminopeptidase 1D, mitochondrial [Anopheles ziemanni]